MEIGILYHEKMTEEDVKETNFSFTEVRYQEKDAVGMAMEKGLIVSLQNINCYDEKQLKKHIKEMQPEYLVLETIGCDSLALVEMFVDTYGAFIREQHLFVYVENGFLGDDIRGYLHSIYSEAEMLKRIVYFGNQECGETLFGVCLNIGYANLAAKNIREVIEELGEDLRLIHINDNDGFHNDKQMPYTFTKGRGKQTTDWKRIIGAMWRIGYDKKIVFDTEGLFEKTPKPLIRQMMKLLYAMTEEIQDAYTIETRLGQSGKKRILFGSGLMFHNYMYSFGEKYPPEFVVDNNKELWGKEVLGIPIKNPEEILQIPEEERNVFICNMRYDEIGLQLDQMGIAYDKFKDYYYDDSDIVIGRY